jgi:hypothetical protein
MLAGLLFGIVTFLLGLYILEYRALLIMYDKIDDAVIGAELAALGTADKERLGYGEVVLPEPSARNVFDVYLAANLEGVAAGPISVDEFIIYNPGDYPALCPKGDEITETAIHAVVTVPVKRLAFKGLLGETVDITVHRDSDSIFVD